MSAGQSSRFLEILARCGYAARGVVYCIVGAFAFLAAFGSGGGVQGSTGALETLVDQPFGAGVLILMGIGLIGFAMWRLVQALVDPDRNGTSWSAVGTRCGYFISSVVYFGFAATALKMAFGGLGTSKSDDRAAQDWTAWLMSQPYGRWLTGAIAISVAACGIAFLFDAWAGAVATHLRAEKAGKEWIHVLGRVGYAASGVVFIIIGVLLMTAVLHSNPAEARGLGGALVSLQAEPYGSALLAVVAVGLFAFGAFGIVQGIYRRIDSPNLRNAESAISHQAERLT